MKRLLTDKRFWAAVALAATIILAAAGVKVPANVVAAVQAVIQALPSEDVGPEDAGLEDEDPAQPALTVEPSAPKTNDQKPTTGSN